MYRRQRSAEILANEVLNEPPEEPRGKGSPQRQLYLERTQKNNMQAPRARRVEAGIQFQFQYMAGSNRPGLPAEKSWPGNRGTRTAVVE